CVDRLILFFFSSRRRHTRFSRDWSSDVCSSDLGTGTVVQRWTTVPVPYGRSDAETFVEQVERNWAEGTALNWAVRNPEDRSVVEIGRASCRERQWRPRGRGDA